VDTIALIVVGVIVAVVATHILGLQKATLPPRITNILHGAMLFRVLPFVALCSLGNMANAFVTRHEWSRTHERERSSNNVEKFMCARRIMRKNNDFV
jgi:hypothetical protein